jgi:hypothetical protein
MEVSYQIIKYFQFKNGFEPKNDEYGIVSYEYKNRKKVFISNPNLCDDDKICLYLALYDEKPIGRCYYFQTKLKLNSSFFDALSASSLEVHPDFRYLAIGADIVMFSSNNEEFEYNLFAGISPMALPLYKKLKYNILELPKYLLRRNVDIYLRHFGLVGIKHTFLINNLNFFFNIREKLFCRLNYKERLFSVKATNVIPEWINNIVLRDGHSYMEVHDNKWLQWNLDNSFKEGKNNRQSFYIITTQEENLGFFMTKERVIDKMGTILGTVVEWGSKNEDILSEETINKFAIKTFGKNVSYIEVGTVNPLTSRALLKWGFFKSGEEHILFKGSKIKFKDASNTNLWRLRLGYADTILS